MPPGHQLQHALDQAERVPSFDLQPRLCVKTNQSVFSWKFPLPLHQGTGGGGGTEMLPLGNLCDHRTTLFPGRVLNPRLGDAWVRSPLTLRRGDPCGQLPTQELPLHQHRLLSKSKAINHNFSTGGNTPTPPP